MQTILFDCNYTTNLWMKRNVWYRNVWMKRNETPPGGSVGNKMFGNILRQRQIITITVTCFLLHNELVFINWWPQRRLLISLRRKPPSCKCTQAFEIDLIKSLLKSQSFFASCLFLACELGLHWLQSTKYFPVTPFTLGWRAT